MSGDRYGHESEVLTFLTDDGRVLNHLVEGAQPRVGPNKYGAASYLIAFLKGDAAEQDRILRKEPAAALFAGMATLALGVAQSLFADQVLDRLQRLAAELADTDLEGPRRQFRTLGED